MADNNTATEVRRLQWVKGDKRLKIEEIDREEGPWTYFKGDKKARIKTSLIPEFMIEIYSDSDIIKDDVEVKASPPDMPRTESSTSNTVKDSNPIRALLKKQSSKNSVEINLKLKVNVPTKDVYLLLKDSFDDDVLDEITNIATDSINIKLLKSETDKKITKILKSYYDAEKK